MGVWWASRRRDEPCDHPLELSERSSSPNSSARVLAGLVAGIIGALVGLLSGANYGGNYATESEFAGTRGYEAWGLYGALVGFAAGWFINLIAWRIVGGQSGRRQH